MNKTVISLFLSIFLFSACVREPESREKKVVLVYMAAENSLSRFSYENLASILKGANEADLNGSDLYVYIDPKEAAPQLIQIVKNKKGIAEKKVIQTYPEQNSTSPTVMREVMDRVYKTSNCQIGRYGLILWSHATAWLPSDLHVELRSFGQDNTSYMEIDVLGEVLSHYHFDFIIFDACYMASIEVAYQLKGCTDYLLAYPNEVLGPGLPYEEITQHLFSKQPTAEALTTIGQTFYRYYDEQQAGTFYPKSAAVTLMRTSGLEPLARISQEILANRQEEVLALDINVLQPLDYLERDQLFLFDFEDFIKHLATSDQYHKFKAALDQSVIYQETTELAYYALDGKRRMLDRTRFCGISTYLPQSEHENINRWYSRLSWSKRVYQ